MLALRCLAPRGAATAASRALSAAAAAAAGAPGAAGARKKHETPKKRANKMLAALNAEHVQRAAAARSHPDFFAGDAVEVVYQPGNVRVEHFRGVVLGRSNKGLGSTFDVVNYDRGVDVLRQFPLYAPSVKEIKVLQKAFIHNGRKRVKRARINYLLERPGSKRRVKPAAGTSGSG